jgi:hypothetical protein
MVDTSLEMASTMDYQRFPMSTHVNMKYNDEEIDITGTYDRRQNSQNGKLKIKSPFSKNFILSVDQANDGELTTSASILFISGFASILVIALNVDIPPLTRREYSNFLTVSNGSTIDVLTILVLSHLNLFSTAITSFLPYWIDERHHMNKYHIVR